MALKYSNLGTTPVKITEVLQKSAENRQEFDENLQSLSSRLKINKNCIAFCKNCAEVLKIHTKLELCTVESESSLLSKKRGAYVLQQTNLATHQISL